MINEGQLEYHVKSNAAPKMKGAIKLAGATVAASSASGGREFTVKPVGGSRVYTLRAPSEEEAKSWVAILTRAAVQK